MLTQAAAGLEAKFPGDAQPDGQDTIPDVDTSFEGQSLDIQRSILRLDVLRLAERTAGSPEQILATAKSYMDWIDGK